MAHGGGNAMGEDRDCRPAGKCNAADGCVCARPRPAGGAPETGAARAEPSREESKSTHPAPPQTLLGFRSHCALLCIVGGLRQPILCRRSALSFRAIESAAGLHGRRSAGRRQARALQAAPRNNAIVGRPVPIRRWVVVHGRAQVWACAAAAPVLRWKDERLPLRAADRRQKLFHLEREAAAFV
jgi:hypothetical protein